MCNLCGLDRISGSKVATSSESQFAKASLTLHGASASETSKTSTGVRQSRIPIGCTLFCWVVLVESIRSSQFSIRASNSKSFLLSFYTRPSRATHDQVGYRFVGSRKFLLWFDHRSSSMRKGFHRPARFCQPVTLSIALITPARAGSLSVLTVKSAAEYLLKIVYQVPRTSSSLIAFTMTVEDKSRSIALEKPPFNVASLVLRLILYWSKYFSRHSQI